MGKTFLHFLLPLGLFLGGCLPEARIWWAPNGREAVVLTEGTLHLVKPDGKLGDSLADGTVDKTVTPRDLSWLPDGGGFALCRERKIATWDEVSKLVPATDVSKIELLALAIPALLEGAGKLAAAKPLDAEDLLSSLFPGDSDDFLIALLCAYQTHKEAVEQPLLKLPKGSELLAKLNSKDALFTLYEICLVNIREAVAPQSLACSLYAMALPKVSPKQNGVAWLQMGEIDQSPSVEASSLDGRERLTVCESAKATFDWSPDGRAIVFAVPVGGKDDSLAKIQRVTVMRESGALMKEETAAGSVIPAPVELGVAMLLDPPRLQVLPDGRVLFASRAGVFPAVGSAPVTDPKLYVVSSDGKKLEAVATAPGTLPANLSFFAASPDGKLAAVVESGNDAVAIVDLATGAVEVISPAHTDWRCRTMPAWMSSDELTFAALGKIGESPGWMLWSKAGGVRSISEKWPAQATSDWLEKENPQKEAPQEKTAK